MYMFRVPERVHLTINDLLKTHFGAKRNIEIHETGNVAQLGFRKTQAGDVALFIGLDWQATVLDRGLAMIEQALVLERGHVRESVGGKEVPPGITVETTHWIEKGKGKLPDVVAGFIVDMKASPVVLCRCPGPGKSIPIPPHTQKASNDSQLQKAASGN